MYSANLSFKDLIWNDKASVLVLSGVLPLLMAVSCSGYRKMHNRNDNECSFEGEITYNADVHSVAGAQRPRFQIDEKEERGEEREEQLWCSSANNK